MATSFEPKKAAQVSAFFCSQEKGQKINVLKLVKLLYLADRESMARCGSPITHDQFVSMRNGPVVSQAYDFIKGKATSEEWNALIGNREKHTVGLARELTESDDDELSRFEVKVLAAIWEKFGAMDHWALERWTHNHCPEWEYPGNSSKPIPYDRVFKSLDRETADARAEHLSETQKLRLTLAKKK